MLRKVGRNVNNYAKPADVCGFIVDLGFEHSLGSLLQHICSLSIRYVLSLVFNIVKQGKNKCLLVRHQMDDTTAILSLASIDCL